MSAQAGRGTHTIVEDNDQNLTGLVIKALSQAMEPSIQDFQYGFSDSMSEPEELYRNTLIRSIRFMSASMLEEFKFCFKAPASDGQ